MHPGTAHILENGSSKYCGMRKFGSEKNRHVSHMIEMFYVTCDCCLTSPSAFLYDHIYVTVCNPFSPTIQYFVEVGIVEDWSSLL